MTLAHRVAAVVRWICHRDRAEQDLDRELRTFVEMAATDKEREGVAPAEARRLALIELGGLEQTKERVRTSRHGGLLDEIGRDVRYACRMFLTHRGFSAVVVLMLTLGIGANTAIFSLIDALILRALPVPNPHELVQVTYTSAGERDAAESVSYAMVRALAAERDIFARLTGFSGNTYDVGPPGAVARTRGAVVSGDYYGTLGLQPAAGRLLTPADDEPGAPLAAVLSDAYWQRQFARRLDAIGSTLLVNRVPVTIVGVSPAGFSGANVGAAADVTITVAALAWVEPEAVSLLGPGNFWLRVLARPAPGLSRSEAQARLTARWHDLTDRVVPPRWPASQRTSITDATVRLLPGATGWTYLREIYTQPLVLLMGAVALVLLIACANVASLLLARASSRQREIAVRLAIGAGRGRIVRQLLIESLLLAFAGAALGVGVAWLSGSVLVDIIASSGNPLLFDLTPNLRVLAFTTTIAVITAILFGVAPALASTSVAPAAALAQDTRVAASRSRLLPSLVIAQVALSLILLVGAALFGRTLQNLQTFDPGFAANGVLLTDLATRRTAIPNDVIDEVRRVPGVVAASVSTHTPLSGSIWSDAAVPAGQAVPERDTAVFVAAGPGFFATLQMPLLAGREFTVRDSAQSTPVAIVNERYAQRYFDGRNPVGEHLAAHVRGKPADLEIVGLAKNTHATGLRTTPAATVYVAYAQLTGDVPTTLEVRVSGNLNQATTALTHVLQARFPHMPVRVQALSTQVAATMVRERMMATLAGTLGVLALLLAAIGLYGLLSYRVTQRTKEIGIRMAVGAARREVVALVLRGAGRLVLTGIVVGVPGVWAVSRWIQSLLFGIAPMDPAAIAVAIVVMLVVAHIAAALPAWRAARVDPLPALRHE